MATDLVPDADAMTGEQLDAATDPAAPVADSGEVSQEERDRRAAAGLGEPFDDDDDDLDENLKPANEKDGDEKDPAAKKEGDEEEEEEREEGDGTIPDTLSESARRYGLDVDRLGSREALEAAVEAMNKMLAAEGEALLTAADKDAKAPKADPATPPKAPDPASQVDDTTKEPVAKVGKFKLDEVAKKKDEYGDPELIDALVELRDVVANLQENNQKEQARQAKAAEQAEQEALEAFFGEMSENPVWAELFGTAAATELVRTPEGKKQFENRCLVLRKRDAFEAGLESRRQPIPAERKLLEDGLALAFGEQAKKAAQHELAEKLRTRHKGSPPRPTQRSAPKRTGGTPTLDAAVKRVGLRPNG